MTISPEYRRWLVIMVKEPRPGKVKTRLGKDIGMTTAAWWFRHQANLTIRQLRHPSWNIVLAVSPDVEGLNSRIWPRDISRWPQGEGNIGQRMLRIFDELPKGPVIIVGADIPDITTAHIMRAFKCLGSNEAVFGPATDGGFWLVGLKRMRPKPVAMFSGVRWSSRYTLSDSVRSIKGLRIAITCTLADVDEAKDL